MTNFANVKNSMNNVTGHKEYFNGRTAACLACSLRFDLPNLLQHAGEDHTMVDILEGFAEASFYIDDLETRKKMRYKK